MKKANFTIRQFLAAFALLFCAGSVMAQQTITRDFNPGAFNNEVGWEIIDLATNAVIDCEATGFPNASGTPVNYVVNEGTYEVRGFDCFGDTWNGGQLNVLQAGCTIFSTNGPTAGPLFPGGNTCNGVPSPGNGTNGVLGTFEVVTPCGLTCPANMVVDNDPGSCGAVVNFLLDIITANPNCTGIVADPPSGSEFQPGTTTVTVNTGSCVNECSFDITVADTEPPTVVCPADIVVTLGPGECSKIVDFNVTASDNCPFPVPGGTVEAPGSNSNGQRGVQFDVRNDGATPILLTSFDANISFGTHPAEVWYTNGSTAIGVAGNQSAWTLLGSATVTGQNWPVGSPLVNIPVGGLMLQPGESKGIYVTVTDFGIVGYSNGNQTTTDGTLTIISNGHSGGTYPFGSQ
ncbi:MAG: hypothetical protein ACE5FF_09695, partial [Saprospiraceae bacterium]